MRKIIISLVTIGLIGLVSTETQAEESALNVSGFVDTHYGKTVQKGYLGNPANNSGSFFLDAVIVYLDKPIGEKYRVFADLGFYNDGGASVDQAFAEGKFLDEKLTLTLGKFDAPIGFELVDAIDMFQFSHSIVYDSLIPGYHTGLMANIGFTDSLSLILYLTNGIDLDSDDNKEKGIGGRLGYGGDTVSAGVSFVRSNNTADSEEGAYNKDASTQIIDVDLTITPSDELTIGGEFNLNTEDDGSADRTAMGILAMCHYDFYTAESYSLGVTARLGYIDWDDDIDTAQTELTAALTGVLDPAGAGFVLEYRIDSLDYTDAPDDMDEHTVALEFTFGF